MNVNRQSKSEGYAISSIVFGAFGLMLFWIPYIGLLIAIIALALAAISFIRNLLEQKNEIIVYVALVIAIIATSLSAKISYKTTAFVNKIISKGSIQIKRVINNADIYTDSNTNDVHIVIHQKDSLNKQFKNLEDIIEQLDSTNTDFH